MTQVIVQPAGNAGGREHYEDTVAKPVELTRITPQLDEATRRHVLTRFGEKAVAVWGVTSGGRGTNAAKWQKIQEGDIALFLQKGRAVARGTVALKVRSAKLAKSLWGVDEDGETWEKQGRRGGLLQFAEAVTEYRGADGELVVTARSVGVRTGQTVKEQS